MLNKWYYLIVYYATIILVKTIFETTTFVLKTNITSILFTITYIIKYMILIL